MASHLEDVLERRLQQGDASKRISRTSSRDDFCREDGLDDPASRSEMTIHSA